MPGPHRCAVLLLVLCLLAQQFGVNGEPYQFKPQIHHHHHHKSWSEAIEPYKTNAVGFTRQSRIHKRGIVSGLVYTAAIATQLTSIGLTIAGAVTDGCSYEPSICTNKDAIKELDRQIQEKKEDFQIKYERNRVDYLKVRNATVYNKQVLYYLNESFQAMTEIDTIESDINSLFMARLPKLHQMYEQKNTSVDAYLTQVLTPVQVRLEDLNKMIQDVKKAAIMGLVIEYLVEIVAGKMIKTFTTSYNNVKYDVDSAEGFRFFMREVMSVDDEALEKYTLETKDSWKQKNSVDNPSRWERMKTAMSWTRTKQRFSFAGRVLKDLGLRLNNFVRVDLPRSARLWWRVIPGTPEGSWKGFKGKLHHTFIKPIKSGFTSFKAKLANPISTLRGVQLGWSGGIMTTLGMIGDVINIVMQANEWAKVADEMRKAKVNYEYYLGNLTREVQLSEEEYANLTVTWDEQVSDFVDMASSLSWFIKNVTQYENLGLLDKSTKAQLPVDVDLALFNTRLDDVTRENLLQKQKVVLDAIVAFGNDLKAVRDEVYARFILYSQVTNKVQKIIDDNEESSLSDLLDSIREIFTFQKEALVKEYGQALREFDLLCTVSVLFPDLSTFDFYPLEDMRPSCTVTPEEFSAMQQAALTLRLKSVLTETTTRMAETNKSVADILDQVKHEYNDIGGQFASYGSSLTERNVLCTIAEVFPSRADYEFYILDDFRPTCPTEQQFEVLKDELEEIMYTRSQVEAALNTHKNFGFFPCDLNMFAMQLGITPDEAKMFIKDIDPTLTEICSPPYCPTCIEL